VRLFACDNFIWEKTMTKWEYLVMEIFLGKCCSLKCSLENFEVIAHVINFSYVEAIDMLGLYGWELVQVLPSTSNFEEDRHYFFKRKVL